MKDFHLCKNSAHQRNPSRGFPDFPSSSRSRDLRPSHSHILRLSTSRVSRAVTDFQRVYILEFQTLGSSVPPSSRDSHGTLDPLRSWRPEVRRKLHRCNTITIHISRIVRPFARARRLTAFKLNSSAREKGPRLPTGISSARN